MKKILVYLLIFTIFLTALIGCSNEAPKEFNSNQLTRVDVQILTDEVKDDEKTITEEGKIKVLREVFANVDWEQSVKAEMSRKEDVKATLFITFDKNMPERLFEYFIWFDHDDASATIIDREKNALGTLGKEDAHTLKDILFHD
jgi:hypothetical protein